MTRGSAPRLLHAGLVALASVTIALGFPPSSGGDTAPPLPNSMASLGDSITRAYNACGFFSDCTARSWSTGNDAAVNSHYQRIRKKNEALTAHNVARSGAKVDELEDQAASAVFQGVEYVTILVGANDACTSSESDMTSLVTFEERFRAAVETLTEELPEAALFVSSIPDIKKLWLVGKDEPDARNAWEAFDICQSILANPTSTDPADEARRDRVRRRVIDYNDVLEEACLDHRSCKFDENAVFSYPFTLGHVSRWDYFHPNATGQAVLADVTYRKGFGW
ncbi:MAG: DUF7118 family protein [Actinomycetota bacterium]